MEMKTTPNNQPDVNDPQEQSIREKLRTLQSTEWSKGFFEFAKENQTKFINESLVDTDVDTRGKYLKLLEHLSDKGQANIIYGSENLKAMNDKSFILITNHIGTAKINRINLDDLNLKKQTYGEIEPFPIRVAPIMKISKELGASIHECANELPEPFARIQEKSGVITLPSTNGGKTEILQKKISDILSNKKEKQIFVMYPEGGTTGKRNSGGPYDLDTFHTGAFVVAKKIGLPILPVFQIFNPESGFELKIIDPIFPDAINDLNYKEIAEKTQIEMQRLSPQ